MTTTKDCRVRRIDVDTFEELDLVALDGDGDYRDSAHRDDIVHDNTRKAGFAATALVEYARVTGGQHEDLHTLISDLIGDLHHLADGLGIDLASAYQTGHDDYSIESQGQF